MRNIRKIDQKGKKYQKHFNKSSVSNERLYLIDKRPSAVKIIKFG